MTRAVSKRYRIGMCLASACLAACSHAVAAPLTPISFSPANPVAGTVVAASLSAITICGTPQVTVSGSAIAIVNSAGPPCVTYPILSVSLGALPAGTYDVTWSAATDVVPGPGPFAAGTLMVGPATVSSAPTLLIGLGISAVRRLVPRRRSTIVG